AVFTDQRHELLCGNQEGYCVDKTKKSQNDEPSKPIRITAMENGAEEFLVRHCKEARSPTRPNIQRSTLNAQHGLLQPNSFENGDEPRIVAQQIPSWIDLQKSHMRIALITCSLQGQQC